MYAPGRRIRGPAIRLLTKTQKPPPGVLLGTAEGIQAKCRFSLMSRLRILILGELRIALISTILLSSVELFLRQ